MFPLIASGIAGIIEAFTGLLGAVDKLHTSDEERLAHKVQLTTLYLQIVQLFTTVQLELAKLQADVIKAEMASADPMVRRARPLLAVLAAFNLLYTGYATSLGWPHMSEQVALVFFGLVWGIWGVSRGIEKITANLKNGRGESELEALVRLMKQKEET